MIYNNPVSHIILSGFILAVILLVAFGLPGQGSDNRRVVFGDADVEQVRAAWIRTWQREPTIKELRTHMQNYIREEILYREALERQYDKDDMVIKRSLVRKMDFFAASQVQASEISEDEIKAYFALRPDRYRIPRQISFVHIFFNRDQRGNQVVQDVKSAIQSLEAQAINEIDPANYGDRFMLQHNFTQMDHEQVSAKMGSIFADTLFNLSPNKWHGPLVSGYGLHAVYIYKAKDAEIPKWSDIKSQIFNDMIIEEKLAAKEQFYIEILRQYQIEYEGMAELLLSGETVE